MTELERNRDRSQRGRHILTTEFKPPDEVQQGRARRRRVPGDLLEPPIPTVYYMPILRPHKCPVCEGRGDDCTPCDGTGVLWGN